MIEADREYLDNPTLSRLCAMVAELIFRWEHLTHESSFMRGVSSSGSAPSQGKYSKGVNQNDITKTRARLGIGGDARVAIVLATIAICAA